MTEQGKQDLGGAASACGRATVILPEHMTGTLPLGPLHDQTLRTVTLTDETLTLVFASELYPEDLTDPSVYERYKGYRTCTLSVLLVPDGDSYCQMETAISLRGRYHGLYLALRDAVPLLRQANAVRFLYAYPAMGALVIELDVCFPDGDACRPYWKYVSGRLTLSAARLTCEWQ